MPKPPGRHPHLALTPVKVNSIKKAGRHADGNGLYLMVDPSGARRWILRTIVRGKTVYIDGKVVGERGYGRQARAKYPH